MTLMFHTFTVFFIFLRIFLFDHIDDAFPLCVYNCTICKDRHRPDIIDKKLHVMQKIDF